MRRPQFSLKFLFILTTVVAIWIGYEVNRVERQRRFVAAIEPLGGGAWYSYQVDADGESISSAVPPGPAWLRSWVGDDYFTSIYGASVPGGLDKDLAVLDDADSLRELTLGSRGITDKGIRRLLCLTRLKRLTVLDSAVKPRAFEAFAALSDLKYLCLSDKNFTESDKDRLARLMPQCEIVYRRWQNNFQANRDRYPPAAAKPKPTWETICAPEQGLPDYLRK